MQLTYGSYGPQTCITNADIVDARSQEIPLAYCGLLVQSEYLNIVVESEPLYQSKQCRNHTILSRSINTSWYYQRNAHILARPAALLRP